jgi:hypothetical protein
MNDMNNMLLGGIAAASFVAGLFFLRYWLSTRDRFFLFFMLAFWIEAVNRVAMVLSHATHEDDSPAHYVVRLVAYGLILVAIWDKNRPGRL